VLSLWRTGPAKMFLVPLTTAAMSHADRRMDARLRRIQAKCGELCNLRRPTVAHRNDDRFNYSSASVDCGWLLADDTGIDATLEQPWPPVTPPDAWLDEFTMHGRYPLHPLYVNNSYDTGQAGGALEFEHGTNITQGWSAKRIDGLVAQAQGKIKPPPNKPKGATATSLGWAFWTRYSNLNRELWAGIHLAINGAGVPFSGEVTGKNVLVIGSQSPWVEGICLGAGAAHVFTLEYAEITTNHPRVTTLAPPEFLARARAGALPRFDVVVTASSLEHSGLGRYNDGLNPWGDILAVARAWCVSSPRAQLVIAVPTTTHGYKGRESLSAAEAAANEQDVLHFNEARTYGPVRYPYLPTNWRLSQRIFAGSHPAYGQTVYVFNRTAGGPQHRRAVLGG